MDAKGEKIALFRYALVAPLVLEALPRGELTRRAESWRPWRAYAAMHLWQGDGHGRESENQSSSHQLYAVARRLFDEEIKGA